MHDVNNQYPVNYPPPRNPGKPSKKTNKQESTVDKTAKNNLMKKTFEGAKSLFTKKKKGEKEVERPAAKEHQAEKPVLNELQLKDLPQEMVLQILKLIPGNYEEKVKALANFGLTDKEYHAIASDKSLWDSAESSKIEVQKKKYYSPAKQTYEKWIVNFRINPDKYIPPKMVKLALRYEFDSEVKNLLFHSLLKNTLLVVQFRDSTRALRILEGALDKWGNEIVVTSKEIKSLKKRQKELKNLAKQDPGISEDLELLNQIIDKAIKLKKNN